MELKERWLEVKNTNGRYFISDHGNVKSVKIYEKTRTKELLLKPGHVGTHRSYLTAHLFNKFYYIHRLVAYYFIQNPNNYTQVNHIDNNPSNNHYLNLQWCTNKQNINHAIKQGRMLVGMKNGNAKFSNKDILDIRRKQGFGFTITYLAKEYNVDRATIKCIINRTTWQHID